MAIKVLAENKSQQTLPSPAQPATPLPLENGDHLTRAEFERRYEAMPEVKKADLIEGVVELSKVLADLRQGIESESHTAFVKEKAKQAK